MARTITKAPSLIATPSRPTSGCRKTQPNRGTASLTSRIATAASCRPHRRVIGKFVCGWMDAGDVAVVLMLMLLVLLVFLQSLHVCGVTYVNGDRPFECRFVRYDHVDPSPAPLPPPFHSLTVQQGYFSANDRSHYNGTNPNDSPFYRSSVLGYLNYRDNGTIAPVVIDAQGVNSHNATHAIQAENFQTISEPAGASWSACCSSARPVVVLPHTAQPAG
jgi:hypothetical protein